MGVRLMVWLAVSIAALVAAATALAQDGPYEGEAGGVQDEVSGRGQTQTVLGQLPFTGLDLALIAGAALLLIVVGVGIRRLNSRRI